jgi:hypothetical protein
MFALFVSAARQSSYHLFRRVTKYITESTTTAAEFLASTNNFDKCQTVINDYFRRNQT